MKMTVKKSVLGLLSLAAVLAFSGCHSYDIYNSILEEVEINDLGIQGHINSFLRSDVTGTDKLYCTNGYVYEREVPSTLSTYDEDTESIKWTRILTPADLLADSTVDSAMADAFNTYGGKILYLASDSSYLYALTMIRYEDTDSENQAWRKDIWYTSDGTSWNLVDLSSYIGEDNSQAADYVYATASGYYVKLLFTNHASSASNRAAYLKLYNTTDSAWKIYKLSGSSLTDVTGTNNASSSSISCCNFNGTDYFSSGYDIQCNDTYMYYTTTSDVTSSSYRSKIIYYANGWDSDNGFTLDGSDAGSVTPGTGYVMSLGVTADYLLIGSSTGIYQAALTSGVPAASTTSFTTNASSIFTTSYEVYPLFVVDSTLSSTETDIYGAMAIEGTLSSTTHGLFEESGLYAYYAGRGTWNKDGTSSSSDNGQTAQ